MRNFIQLFTALCFVLSSTMISAQSNSKFSLSAGIGALPTFIGDNATVNTPPINARITYQMTPAFSLSGYVGYSSSTSSSPYIISDGKQSLVSNKQTLMGLRGELKKNISKKFDVYGGALFGYNKNDIREFDKASGETVIRDNNTPTPYNPDRKNGEFLYSGFVGTTFHLQKGIGLFAEVGYGVSLLNTGITIKI